MNLTKDKSLEKVAKSWSKTEPILDRCFFGFAPMRYYLIKTAFGALLAERYKNSGSAFEDIIVAKYLSDHKPKRVLSLCCGYGSVERSFLKQLPSVIECLAVDLSQGALDVAKRRASEEGLSHIIQYERADLNNYAWESEKYDFIIANGALHHLARLEDALVGIKGCLNPGGVLYANEHVGASYQDYPLRQLELINAMGYLVPRQLRKRIGTPFRHSHKWLRQAHRVYHILNGKWCIADPYERPTWSKRTKILAAFLRTISSKDNKTETFNFGILQDSKKKDLLKEDPSECVSSSDIIPLTKKLFPNVEIRSYGGALIAYALDSQFYDNYDDSDSLHRKTLELLWEIEEHYTKMGELGIEHAVIIGRK